MFSDNVSSSLGNSSSQTPQTKRKILNQIYCRTVEFFSTSLLEKVFYKKNCEQHRLVLLE